MDEVKFLLKFGRKEHIEAFANGGLYCSNAETFWGIENELKLKGQGDRLEASSKVFAQRMAIYDNDDNSLVAEVGMSNALVRYEPAKKFLSFVYLLYMPMIAAWMMMGICKSNFQIIPNRSLENIFPMLILLQLSEILNSFYLI